MRITNFILYALIATAVFLGSCKKDFLNEKPSTAIVQPSSLEEFQSLLENFGVNNSSVVLGVVSADDHEFYNETVWKSVNKATERNAYVWAKDLYDGERVEDWNKPYATIFYANNILKGLDDMKVSAFDQARWNNLKGWALFIRAFAYYDLVSHFAPTYDNTTAATDLGVPLRLNPSIDVLLPRATVKENYERILVDLSGASQLLEVNIPAANRNRPSKVAAHALFARIYLTMRNYNKAELHADTSLTLYSKLIDYNTLSKTANQPFSLAHDELIYAKSGYPLLTSQLAPTANTFVKIAPDLINLYEPNDLRPAIYFTKQTDGSYRVKRGYNGPNVNAFVGLATDEVYLIKAECLARRSEINASMTVLNQLLVKRWDPAATTPAQPYQNRTAANQQEAVSKVLLERRKELVWRGLRWDDLKRLNKEGANITLNRNLNGTIYSLPPNSPKYIFPIPDEEIALSGIQQNLR